MPLPTEVCAPNPGSVQRHRCRLATATALAATLWAAGCTPSHRLQPPAAPITSAAPVPVDAAGPPVVAVAGVAALPAPATGASAAASGSGQPAPGVAAPPPAASFDASAARLLAYGERLRELGPADVAREQVRLAEATDDPASRLQLALLLAQSRQNGDLARALAALEPLTRPSASTPWRAAAKLLQDRLLEQRRLEEQAERQSQQVRDQQRRIDQLSTQLEALRAIERSISGRPPLPGSAPAPSPAPGSLRPSP